MKKSVCSLVQLCKTKNKRMFTFYAFSYLFIENELFKDNEKRLSVENSKSPSVFNLPSWYYY